jgi:broad specificity phosphatase PhoE
MSCRYVSPRRRAQRTLELLGLGCREKMPWQVKREHPDTDVRTEAKVQIIEDIREWDYGDYEGLTSKTIAEQRERDGQEPWDIWRDGCPGGELVFHFDYLNHTYISLDLLNKLRNDWTV